MTNPMASPPFPPTDDNLELLTELLLALDEVQHIYAWLVMHFEGAGPLAYLAPEARAALGNRFDRFNINLARLTVTSIAERLRLSGWGGADGDAAQAIWQRDDMDVRIRQAFNEALLLGRSELFVWPQNGLARISVESAQQTAVLGDPGTRCPTSAVKRWRTRSTTETLLLTPDAIQHYRASAGATVGGFQLVDEQPNSLGEVPVASLVNADRLPLYWGVTGLTEFAYPERGPFMGGSVRSEVWDVIPIAQAITKILMDMLVTSERLARPARWATGIELVERPRINPSTGQPVLDSDGNPVIDVVSPIDLTDMTMTAEPSDAKFGTLAGAELNSYAQAVSVLVSMLQAVAALPAHYLGQLQNQVPSADGLRAAEASLVAKCEEKQLAFSVGLRRAMKLAIACETGRDPRAIDVNPQWCDASNASMAQEADAVVKLHAANLLPTSFALRKLGYSEAEIDQARQDMTADVAAQKAGDPLSQYMNRANPQL